MPNPPPHALVRPLHASDVRQSLRAVLEVLLERPGSPLYNPVFVGPLESAGPVYEALRAIAAARGFRLSLGGDVPREPGAAWLADVETAERELASGAEPGYGVQWVVWGASDAGALPDRLAARVSSAGIPVRPGAGSGDPATSDLAAAVEIALRDAGEARRRHFVVVVGAAEDLDVLAAELHFQLETAAVGVPRVRRGPAAAWLSRVEGGPGARVLVCGEGEGDGEELAARLEAEPGAGIWGLVVEGGRFACWSAGGAWSRLLARARVVNRTPPPPLPLPERALPGLGELLLGSACAARVVEDPVLFHLRLVPLAEVLQSAVGWSAPGTLVVFGRGHFGWVEVAHGRIRRVGERGRRAEPAPRPEEEVYRVLERMAAWEDASAAFVPAERPVEHPDRSEGVPVGHALFAVAKAADEGGPGAGGGAAGGGLRAYQVAEALLEWGLPSLAGPFLERAERASAWGAEEDLLLGHLTAGRNPQAAAARLRHGALRAVSAGARDPARLAVYVSATLGALLLEVRAGYTVPSVALGVIRGWLDDAGTGWVADARHAAIWLEIALRAGEGTSAGEAQRTLEELAGVERSRWTPLLELSLSRDGGVTGGGQG